MPAVEDKTKASVDGAELAHASSEPVVEDKTKPPVDGVVSHSVDGAELPHASSEPAVEDKTKAPVELRASSGGQDEGTS